MRRRDFVAGLGSTAAWPLVARAQRGERMRLVAVLRLSSESDPSSRSNIAALREGLRKLGWIDGGNIRIQVRFAHGDFERARSYADEFILMNPDVILTGDTPIVQELQKRTQTIPIVFPSLADPVASGIVPSLAHPGGNTTGFMNPEPAMSAKWLEMLKEVAPNLSRVLVMVNAGNVGNTARLKVIEAGASSLGVQVSSAHIRAPSDVETAIAAVANEMNVGFIVCPGPPLQDFGKLISGLAARHHLPSIFPFRFFVTEGGLMSYGAETAPMWAQAAAYVNRILNGEKPGDLPVQAPVKFELVINMKTAKALGLTIPETLLATADEVIQ
jgi:putative tryptophan/tyrosine transport system substrate-binding protein